MLNEQQKSQIRQNKLNARRIRLSSFHIVDFTHVPDFIIDAFFDENTYLKRLHVSTFSFVNKINFENVLKLVHWKKDNHHEDNIEKLRKLIEIDYNKTYYQQKYYSYDVRRGLNVYLDGRVRYFGQPV